MHWLTLEWCHNLWKSDKILAIEIGTVKWGDFEFFSVDLDFILVQQKLDLLGEKVFYILSGCINNFQGLNYRSLETQNR